MGERIPQSVAYTVLFKAYLASDHTTEATGKNIAITISKNKGAFGNPSAGATNATEISGGWYYVDLSTTDTGTIGALAVRGAVATIDDVGIAHTVVDATNGGLSNLDATITSRTKPADTQAAVTVVNGIAANVITAASIATDAIDADSLKADAVTEIQSGLATSSSISTLQTSVDDIPTNAELATALGTADDAVLAAIAALNNLSQANIRTAVGLGSANLDTQLDALPTNAELATALGTADDAVLAAIAALTSLDAAGIRSAIGLASANLDTQLDALPTNAELATALGTADDAVLAAIAALNNLSQANVRTAIGLGSANLDTQLAAIAAYIDTEVGAIKAKTDLIPGTVDGKTLIQGWTLILAVLLGKASGMATTTAVFRAIDDSKDRVTATVDADGNRSAVTLDAT